MNGIPPRTRSGGATHALLVVACLASPAVYVAGAWLLHLIAQRWPALDAVIDVTLQSHTRFDLIALATVPLGILGVNVFCLTVEARVLGYERSSLARLVESRTPTAGRDLFYLWLRLSGGIQVMSFFMSLGSVYLVANLVRTRFQLSLLAAVPSFLVQFAVVYLVNTLVFYLAHRAMHSRFLWEIHKIHHSAEEMNIITPTRNHPIDYFVMTVVNAFPGAILGASVTVELAYLGINAIYQCLVHSEMDWKGRAWDAVLITPGAHRVHHSADERHWNRNFGIITLWDKVFGTYLPPGSGPLTYGVTDREHFNTGSGLAETVATLGRWRRSLAGDSEV